MKRLLMGKFKKTYKILLIIIWMLVVFTFSGENGEKSSDKSKAVTMTLVKSVHTNVDKDSILVNNVERVIRKLAHYTLYTIGGFLIINYFYILNIETKEKVIYSTTIGVIYSITDELHQFFVSERSAQILDIGIDSLGIITGIIIYIFIKKCYKNKISSC